MQVFFTKTDLLHEVVDGGSCCQGLETGALGLVDGMPFILDDDGSYDHYLNRFFRTLPTRNAPSPNTWQAYAQDIVLWMRFLRIRGKTIWEADNEDLAAFWIVRRISPTGRTRIVTKSTWSRWVSALDKFYSWALTEKLISAIPFTYESASRMDFSTGESQEYARNQAHERGAKRGLVKYLSLAQYLFFRDVGLRGRLPDGRLDRRFRGRNGTRNATYAELLTNTGLRNGEGSHLLCCELPAVGDTEDASLAFQLPGVIAKGGNGREILLPIRVVRLTQEYIEIEREVSLARAFDKSGIGEYTGIEKPVYVSRMKGRRAYHWRDDGSSRTFQQLSRNLRRRVVEYEPDHAPQPGLIWLTEQGRPMQQYNWNRIFQSATRRCRQFAEWNTLVNVTPHTLRHTFAVNMLAALTRAFYGRFSPDLLRDDLIRAEKEITANPLLKLKQLLGHKHLATTMIYLEYMDEAREIVETASSEWAARTAPGW